MRHLLALLVGALLVTTVQAASLQAKDPVSVITITDGACTSEKAASQLPELNRLLREAGKPEVFRGALHGGSMTHKGDMYQTCWIRIDDVVVVMDDGLLDTSIFPVPVAAFRAVDPI